MTVQHVADSPAFCNGFPQDSRRFLFHVTGLRPAEIGVYAVIFALTASDGPQADNERFLAGYCGCDVRTFRGIKRALIDAGKLTVVDGSLVIGG